MFFIIIIISIWIFIKTVSYGIYEIKKNSNTIGGFFTIVLAVFALILPNLFIFLNGLY